MDKQTIINKWKKKAVGKQWPLSYDELADVVLNSSPDIRMRIWIPYSLKYGLGNSIICEKPNSRLYPLPPTYEWTEFVAINDPLVNTSEKENLMSKEQEHIFALILAERGRQDLKWGSQRDHSNFRWLAILIEEVGETAKAILEGVKFEIGINEIVQVAAVAVCWLESLFYNQKEPQEGE